MVALDALTATQREAVGNATGSGQLIGHGNTLRALAALNLSRLYGSRGDPGAELTDLGMQTRLALRARAAERLLAAGWMPALGYGHRLWTSPDDPSGNDAMRTMAGAMREAGIGW